MTDRQKKEIRRDMFWKREHLSAAVCEKNSAAICEKLLAGDWYPEAEQILVYSAIRQEVDLRLFVEQAWRDGRHLYFPKVEGDFLRFYRISAFGELMEGAFHVFEPSGREELFLPEKEKRTVVLVPGVAFGADGGRIGYGKGFYDRYLSGGDFYPIGIAHHFQLCEFFAEIHDVPMKRIITEKREVVRDDGIGRFV